ncbi:MAG TPA: GspH/FimT family protein, partial [Gemmatimonadota bacterium]|nr:GspH/FimT family protein [Gemmatimonadota bacterium]
MMKRLRNNRGVTLMELIVVALLLGVVASVALPRALRTTPRQQLSRATRQLARDLELVRTQAVASKRLVRVYFDVGNEFYTAFLDITSNRAGTIDEVEDEVRQSRMVTRDKVGGLPGVSLPSKIVFGYGSASTSPLGGPVSDPVPFDSDRVEFNSRGMVTPLGTQGVVYLEHEDDPSVVAAVTISGAGAF